MAGFSPSGRCVGRLTGARRACSTAWPADKSVGDLSAFGPTRLAQGGARHRAPQERPTRPSRLEKKLPEKLAILLTPEAVRGRMVRLMFQDEARFGRMVRIRRCWAPTPLRPVVSNGYEREFVYVHGAISPIEGELVRMICPKMNPERMGEFLSQIHTATPTSSSLWSSTGPARTYPRNYSSPRTFVCCACLPAPPRLNPQEHIWDELREKEFPNRVFADLASVTDQLLPHCLIEATNHQTPGETQEYTIRSLPSAPR